VLSHRFKPYHVPLFLAKYAWLAARRRPVLVHFEVTLRCNARCGFCDYWKTPAEAKAEELQSFADAARFFMEVRGLGLIDVQALYGVSAICATKQIGLVVQLERWDSSREYERLGLDDVFFEILGLRVPMIRMPVAPGRNIAILVEVAARNQLLRSRGHHSARLLVERLEQRLRQPAAAAGESDDEDDDEIESGGGR